jgi:hypothetical protein
MSRIHHKTAFSDRRSTGGYLRSASGKALLNKADHAANQSQG